MTHVKIRPKDEVISLQVYMEASFPLDPYYLHYLDPDITLLDEAPYSP